MNNTTRRHPRSAGEAFRDADWAGVITTPSGRVVGLHHVIGVHGDMKPTKLGRIGPIPLDTSIRARLVRWYRNLVLKLRSHA